MIPGPYHQGDLRSMSPPWKQVFADRDNQISLAMVALLFALSLGVTYVGLKDYHASILDIRDLLIQADDIRYYDEVLTMSARLGGLTGDLSWERRYDATIPQLDQALQRAGELHPAGQAYLQEVDSANQRLIDAERQALGLARTGRLPEAADLLFGEAYEHEKTHYADGLARFTAELDQARLNLEERLQRVFTLTAALDALLAVKLIIASGAHLHFVLGARRGLAWRRAEAPLILSLLEVLGRAIASQANEEQLFKQATTDPLTGLFNRRYFIEKLEQELKGVRRRENLTALLIVDIDHFKAINDTYGHDAGDAVLRHFALLAQESLRESDLIGRLGGEEFGIILPATDLGLARAVAERLRETIAAAGTLTRLGKVRVTISLGLTLLTAADRATDEPLYRADQALYAAKREGRNAIRQLLVSMMPPPDPASLRGPDPNTGSLLQECPS